MIDGFSNTAIEDSVERQLEHLDAILKSPFFTSSPRCQAFLQYVVLETIRGRGDQIKERNIAFEVFGKGSSFEPSQHSLVRQRAGEVRRRLTEYYEATPEADLRIDLPPGRYIPHIRTKDEPIAKAPPPPEEPVVHPVNVDHPVNVVRPGNIVSRRRFAWMLGASAAAVGAASLWPIIHRPATPLDLFWRPVFATGASLLIFIPVITTEDGKLTEWVGMGPTTSLGRAAGFLATHSQSYHLRYGTDLTFSQLREQPNLLLGGFDLEFTRQLTRGLRYVPVVDPVTKMRAFVDTQTKQTWTALDPDEEPYPSADYGLLCRTFNAEVGQILILALGLKTFGIEGAMDLLFNPELFSSVVRKAPRNWETMNFQALIRVSVAGSSPSLPQLIATQFG